MQTIRQLPLIIALLPALAVTGAFLIAAHYERIPSCMPLLEGCTSISATGRYPPASFLFRGVLMPNGALLILLWLVAVAWLDALQPLTRTARRSIVGLGVLSGVSLIVYVSFLGTQTDFYSFMRRFGIYGYFLGVVLAQLVTAVAYRQRVPGRLGDGMLWIASLPFALGVLNLVLKSLLADADAWENRIEWIAALLMQSYFFLLWLAFRRSDFTLVAHAR